MLLEDLFPSERLDSMTTEFSSIICEGADEELKWLSVLTAFGNTSGGKLYVGIEDKTHEVVALDRDTADRIVLMVHRQISDKVDPGLDYDIDVYPVPGIDPTRYILCVSVKQSKSLPVTVRTHGLLGIYVRRFGRTETASAQQLRELVLRGDSVPYDRRFTERPFSRDDFSRLLETYSKRCGESLTDRKLISLGFMDDTGHLSTGALLFADTCADERTHMTLTQWPGDTKGSDTVLASEDFTGDLLSAIQVAQDFVANHSANGFKKPASSRVDFIAFPRRSVTEGIVAAIGHRNYFMDGTQIEVDVFKDRLEIASPGALPGVRELVREHDIASIIPRRRNEVICAILTACKYMEKKGSSFDKIEEDYEVWGPTYAPFVSNDSSSFTLTLPDLTFEGGVVGDGNEAPAILAIGAQDVKHGVEILSYCYRKDRTATQIAQHLGVTPSSYFRKKSLEALVNQGFLLKRQEGRVMVYSANPSKVHLR